MLLLGNMPTAVCRCWQKRAAAHSWTTTRLTRCAPSHAGVEPRSARPLPIFALKAQQRGGLQMSPVLRSAVRSRDCTRSCCACVSRSARAAWAAADQARRARCCTSRAGVAPGVAPGVVPDAVPTGWCCTRCCTGRAGVAPGVVPGGVPGTVPAGPVLHPELYPALYTQGLVHLDEHCCFVARQQNMIARSASQCSSCATALPCGLHAYFRNPNGICDTIRVHPYVHTSSTVMR